jgi:DNA-binding transcriptional regulator YdaS (Cro superfamily)
MDESANLTPREYDPWRLATPAQLLTLIQRLGVSGRVVARWLGVKPSAISMWSHGTRAIPQRHVPALKVWAERAFAQARQLNAKEVAAQRHCQVNAKNCTSV